MLLAMRAQTAACHVLQSIGRHEQTSEHGSVNAIHAPQWLSKCVNAMNACDRGDVRLVTGERPVHGGPKEESELVVEAEFVELGTCLQ